jgi:signal transduction histidine kinase
LFFYTRYRQADFETRLMNRSKSSVNMLFYENKIDSTALRLVDQNIITAMSGVKILVYDKNNSLIYNSGNLKSSSLNNYPQLTRNWFHKLLYTGESTLKYNFNNYGHTCYVVASATDNQGIIELQNLVSILGWVIIIALLLIIGFGFYNANWSLKPFRKIIREVEAIEPTELKKRLSVEGTDEISQLSQTFNTLLERIAQAFETEKSFIANASHELRTPVTSVLGQIEVVLNKDRSEQEYKTILSSVYEDTTQMKNIINGFLDLAEANLANNQIEMHEIAIDDLLFSIVEDLEQRKPHYGVSVEFLNNPEDDNQIQCMANERLLRIMFGNIIDNACKYSHDKKAKVKIDFTPYVIIISVTDYGIGIANDDLENIFKPLFRGKNVTGKPGHGIGLAIVKRIAELHNASVSINSELNIGSTVTVRIKSI